MVGDSRGTRFLRAIYLCCDYAARCGDDRARRGRGGGLDEWLWDHAFDLVSSRSSGPPAEAAVRRRTEGPRMDEHGSILVTGAAGQLGAVGRMVTGLLLDRGLPVRAMVRREDDRRRRCGSLAPRWWSEIYSNRLTS